MKDFIMAAFPWICIGLIVAVLAAQMSRKKKAGKKKYPGDGQKEKGQQGSSPNIQEENEDSEENYMTTGMCLGMCFGVAIGTALDQLAMGISLGMLIGMCVGMNMKKK
ncbi:MAG: hypothetical protein ACI4BB_13355 [Coprococcus sp.]